MRMESLKQNTKSSGIVYSCYHKKTREGEHFVPEHTLSYQIAGSLILNDGTKEYPSEENSFHLVRRNQLLKFVKYPPENGEFRSLSIYLNQQMLKDFSIEYGIIAEQKQFDKPVVLIKTNPLVNSYINSLLTYHESNSLENKQILDIKLKEGILLLLKTEPELKNILFDFTEPHKIDLEAFMNKNYHFNVGIERFAYLTGRSLATFKRDFDKAFNTSPHRWLLQRRLQEACFLIQKKNQKPIDFYLDLGFEDLSHFSYVFKKQYGFSPSAIPSDSQSNAL